MAWATRQHSKKQIRKAGQVLASGSPTDTESDWAFDVLDNWRAAHAFPLNTIQMWIRRTARRIQPDAVFAQRLKRTPSMIGKLRRFDTMQLDRMQDIGGCRVVVSDIPTLETVRSTLERSRARHALKNEKDYVRTPKADGYRGIHRIYRFESRSTTVYNGQHIEVQLRTQLQHAWATAVEIADTFLPTAIKAGRGPKQWRSFFTKVSSAFAQLEGSPTVDGSPADPHKLARAIDRQAKQLDVWAELNRYRLALKVVESHAKPRIRRGEIQWTLLSLNPRQLELVVEPYSRRRLAAATTDYTERERSAFRDGEDDIVIVRVDSAHELRRAYPNYFMDAEVFLNELDRFLELHLPSAS